MNVFNDKNIYLLVKFITAIVFLWSGTLKIIDPQAFAVTIDAFGIMPEAFVKPVAYLLPVFEVILSFLLFFEVKGSLTIVTCLMLFFIILLAYGINIGLDIDCGCFGSEDPEKRAFSGLKAALYRDIGIMAGILFMIYYRRTIHVQEN